MGAHASDEHEHHGREHGGPGDGLLLDARAQDTCETCRFWGGGKVIAQSMGWCNNPDSRNYRKLTMPDYRMEKVGTWTKWAALRGN